MLETYEKYFWEQFATGNKIYVELYLFIIDKTRISTCYVNGMTEIIHLII